MVRFLMTVSVLALVSSVVVSQDKPKPEPKRVSMFFEETTLYEVMAHIKGDTGYRTIYHRDVDGEVPVSLDCAGVSLEVACLLLARFTDYDIVVNHQRKLIEVLPMGESAVFRDVVVIDTTEASKVFDRGQAALAAAPDVDTREPSLGESWTSLNHALGIIGLDTEITDFRLLGSFLSARLDAHDKALADDALRLLVAENGGRSTTLQAQAETWEKLGAAKLAANYDETPLAAVLDSMRKEFKLNFVVESDARYMVEDGQVTCVLDEMPLLDVLDILLDRYNLRMLLVENVILLMSEDAHAAGIDQSGFAVYELGSLIKERAASAAEPAADVLADIVEGLRAPLDEDPEFVVAEFGTRIAVRGDSRTQAAVEEYLTALGWKAK